MQTNGARISGPHGRHDAASTAVAAAAIATTVELSPVRGTYRLAVDRAGTLLVAGDDRQLLRRLVSGGWRPVVVE